MTAKIDSKRLAFAFARAMSALALTATVSAQTAAPAQPTPTPRKPAPARKEPTKESAKAPAGQPPAPVPAGVQPPPGYVIGPDDVLSIIYWRDKDMSADVQVRPDGKISLALLNDVVAGGLTPDELRERLTEESKKYIEDPSVAVVVKQINSRKVYITGQVGKVGPYPLSGPITVLQLIAMVGGLGEYADSKNIVILRTENGRQMSFRFNYKEVISGKKLSQNIELKPGDTIVVP